MVGSNNPLKGEAKKTKANLSYWLYRVMKEMGWTVQEVNTCPIPTFWLVVENINKEDEKASKQAKK